MAKDKGNRAIDASFGERLKFYRTQRNYTLQDLEHRTKISSSYLNRLERGEKRAPSYPVIQNLAKALGVTAFQLLHVPVDGEEGPKSLVEFLVLSQYTIRDKPASRETRDALTVLLQTIIMADLDNPDGRFQTEMLILQRTSEFLKTLDE